ncbi:unnamed protein product [Ixodes pacificus]
MDKNGSNRYFFCSRAESELNQHLNHNRKEFQFETLFQDGAKISRNRLYQILFSGQVLFGSDQYFFIFGTDARFAVFRFKQESLRLSSSATETILSLQFVLV